ncbi:Aminoglycoside phosphotransferase [Cordyceps fumosorosea ARSEF 2679]|uniref:Aminoglycoside phosphotransferase n=1 Tax=Cordyceps fumosorosea (strain ARSEF 2679) TaxID=1081104 RepID=A0A167MRU7_CORFA|nr:Aminoglycoside phosphotransferase [Cordyceps fumosorosea ARSEF 2679]OAA54686.1 Aminoglycoside phosphotransferase [Cordyceps fumosorosea ARSEF 2679]
MKSHSLVPKRVLDVFGINREAPLKALPGGSLVCYLAGADVVFRPSEDDAESEQIAQIITKLRGIMPAGAGYRVSRPIPVASCPTQFVCDGWTAWSFLSGQGRDTTVWSESLDACRAFHRDIVRIGLDKPEFLDRRLNRFRQADRVAWGETALEMLPKVTDQNVLSRIRRPLARLAELKRPFESPLSEQLVHGDIGGNILFESGGQPPGIIDMTFYWRPAGYAAAIMVADGLLWEKEGEKLVRMYGTDADSTQLLVRALLFRIVTWAIDLPVMSESSDRQWGERMLPLVDFDGAVDTVSKFVV